MEISMGDVCEYSWQSSTVVGERKKIGFRSKETITHNPGSYASSNRACGPPQYPSSTLIPFVFGISFFKLNSRKRVPLLLRVTG